MNINISHVREAFSCLEVTLGSYVTLSTIIHLGVIFVGQPLLGRVTMVLNFLHLYTVCLIVDRYKLFRDDFVTFYDLVSIKNAVNNVLCRPDFDRSLFFE